MKGQKMKRKAITFLASVCAVSATLALVACGEEGKTSTPIDPTEPTAKPTRQVEVYDGAIKNRYFLNDSITVGNVDLAYASGAMTSESYEVVTPSGKTEKAETLTFSETGTYTFKFYLELYKEVIYAEKKVEVAAWEDSFAEIDVVEVNCRDLYCEGNVIYAPKTATLDYFDTEVEGEYDEMISPSGVEIVENTYQFTEVGEYKLKYVYEWMDREFYAYKSVTVNNESFSIIGKESTATYGYDGAKITLKEGEEFFVNRVIDLSKLSRQDTLFSFKLPAQAQAEAKGQPDAMIVNFKLTDIYDEDNYVIISARKRWDQLDYRSWADAQCYVFIGANGQTPGGYYNGNFTEGTGYLTAFSMVNNPAEQTLSFNIDYDERRFYTPNMTTSDSYIADLDDETVYTGLDIFEDVLWEGFTTGECYLSVSAEDYRSASRTCNITFTHIAGVETLAGEKAYLTTEDEIRYDADTQVSLTDQKLTFGGQQYDAEIQGVYTPSGEFKTGTSFTLSESGTYRAIYTAKAGEKDVYAVYYMEVSRKTLVLETPLFAAYTLNDVLTIPKGTVTAFGESYEAIPVLKAPDGTPMTGTEITLSQVGDYVLTYTAQGAPFDFSEGYTLSCSEKAPYASASSANTTIDTNGDFKYGWSNGMFELDIAPGDTVKVNRTVDWGSSLDFESIDGESKYYSTNYNNGTLNFFQFGFDDWTTEQYANKTMRIKLINVKNAQQYLAFDFSIKAGSGLISGSCTDQDGTKLFSVDFAYMIATNDQGKNSLGYTMLSLRIGPTGISLHGLLSDVSGKAKIDWEAIGFTSAVVEISSETGIAASFNEVGGISRYWQK